MKNYANTRSTFRVLILSLGAIVLTLFTVSATAQNTALPSDVQVLLDRAATGCHGAGGAGETKTFHFVLEESRDQARLWSRGLHHCISWAGAAEPMRHGGSCLL